MPVKVKGKNKISRSIKRNDTLVSKKDRNWVVLALLTLSIVLGLSVLSQFVLLFNNGRLANKRTVFVQQPDGTTVEAIEQDENYRSEAVIKDTVGNWLSLIWEWDSRIPGSTVRDTGIQMGSGNKRFTVPTKVYMAGFLLDPEDLRDEYLKVLSTEIPKQYYRGDVTSVFEIMHIGKPTEKDGEYQVNAIGYRTDTSKIGQAKRRSKFRKTITLSPVRPYSLVLGDREPSAFRKEVEKLRRNGLIITSIKDIELESELEEE